MTPVCTLNKFVLVFNIWRAKHLPRPFPIAATATVVGKSPRSAYTFKQLNTKVLLLLKKTSIRQPKIFSDRPLPLVLSLGCC